ncbi:MAG TPA: nicotinate (nicotinamide) nucleotide adenylyltransferase [Acidimicrobiaceae bacterium]|nr:nicotinate (nicotinamide) nucleotide adenylyltransferase [Acidimicrobiaceae bacterium]|tara:strand:+ start:434 stop:1021 length:588 start_codon:yes stop_codon:yes gene_type:complete
MGRRIGLFGGTFDPPHEGHLAAASAAKEVLGLDEVLLVVANDPWQKSSHRSITEARHRLAMTKLLVEEVEGIEVSDVEILRGGESYTIDTVTDMCRQGHEVTLIVGADVVEGIETWERSDELRELVHLAVIDRPGYNPPTLEGWFMERVFVNSKDISSSEVRDQIGEGTSMGYGLPLVVRRYIDQHQLAWQPRKN